MLSHVGSLILYANRNAEMAKVIDRVEQEHIPIEQAEIEQFGAGHPEIGAYLLGLWGFPPRWYRPLPITTARWIPRIAK